MKFSDLLPDTIFETVTEQGFLPTGTLFPLNSYENRVYEIALEEREPIVAKFYRPGRWSLEAIAEEHHFIKAAGEADIPVVAPLSLKAHVPGVETLNKKENMYYAFYPKFRGRSITDLSNDDRKWLGRTLARLHNVGVVVSHRLRLDPQTYGHASLEFLLKQPFLPADLSKSLEIYLLQAIRLTEPFFQKDLKTIVVHGDCHTGNILWNPQGPHLLDFDDMVVAPPVQDVWMLFYGDEEEKNKQRESFFEGYETFRKFDWQTLVLAEPLRTLRMIHYAAWIGQRYEEPAFQRAFPYYEQRRYWEEFLGSIKEQIALLQEISAP